MKDGTYLKTEAGFTPIVATTGYWVAVEETELGLIAGGETFGAWTDSDGKLWVDKTVRLSDLTNALLLGKTFSQKAIYDVANKKEMEVV